MVAIRRFDYPLASIGDLSVRTTPEQKAGKPIVSEVVVDGEPIRPTNRFCLGTKMLLDSR